MTRFEISSFESIDLVHEYGRVFTRYTYARTTTPIQGCQSFWRIEIDANLTEIRFWTSRVDEGVIYKFVEVPYVGVT